MEFPKRRPPNRGRRYASHQPNTVDGYQPHVKRAVGRHTRCHVTLHRERYDHVVGGMQCTLAQYNLLVFPQADFKVEW
jgi:hypothetical protein